MSYSLSLRTRRRSAGEAFRNDRQLQQFVLTGVTPTGRILGTGSYGSVEEMTYKHLVCAGKTLHETLIDFENEGVAEVVRKFLQECQLMSSLRHPNITQFLGLCFLPETQLPLLVMERLETSLDDLLEHMPNLPLSLKRSILEDVACGLLYLHDRQPPVIHRDLTSKNVLLTSSLVAKITDMGNSRIVTMRPGQVAKTLTKYPGTLVYMPPEAQDDIHRYGSSIDIFSFGHLALYTLTQKFPGDLLPSTYLVDPENSQEVKGRTEIERREPYIALLDRINSSTLIDLVKECLQNNPRERPSTEQLLTSLQEAREQVEGEYGGPVKLDLVRLRLAKAVKEKDVLVDELTQQQAGLESELEEARRNVEELTRLMEESDRRHGELIREKDEQIENQASVISRKNETMAAKDVEIATKNEQICAKDEEIATLNQQIATKDGEIANKDGEITTKDEQIARKDEEIAIKEGLLQESAERENGLRRELEEQATEMARLGEELRVFSEISKEKSLKLPLRLTWRRGPGTHFDMTGYIQSVLIQDKLYVGGGIPSQSEKEGIVMEYNTISGEWALLPKSEVHYFFAMTAISDDLVLVGGIKMHFLVSEKLWALKSGGEAWDECSYPEMPTARHSPSTITYKQWLVVAGGCLAGERLSRVDVLDTAKKQWYTGPPTPIPWELMKTALVGDVGYFMSGTGNTNSTMKQVYSVSLRRLISVTISEATGVGDVQIWKTISPSKLTKSTPVYYNGSLLAVGGLDDNKRASTDIHLYQPDSGEWVKVGDLPCARCDCTCAMINGELLVAGGMDDMFSLETVDVALISNDEP